MAKFEMMEWELVEAEIEWELKKLGFADDGFLSVDNASIDECFDEIGALIKIEKDMIENKNWKGCEETIYKTIEGYIFHIERIITDKTDEWI